jgi:MFS family permease
MTQSSLQLQQQPRNRVTGGWIALFGTAWLGIWMAQLTPISLLLPSQITEQLGTTAWLDNVLAFGVISAIAGVFALIAFPLSGALSDRTRSRFGRRRPWILGGTLLFAASLVGLGVQQSIIGIGVFWSLTLIGFCVATAALTAVISDQVPINQRGIVSGWLAAPQALGTIFGLLLVTGLALSTALGYLLVAVLLVATVIPFVLRMPDEPLPAGRTLAPLTLATLISGFWISPRQFPDFGWTLLSRILVNLSNALGTTLLLYFLMFGLGRMATAEDDLLVLVLIYMVFFIVAALAMGQLSDRLGKRKMFVYLAAYLQGFASLILAFVPSFPAALGAAGLLGLGYGCFMAVDQALATQVLPDETTRGKDLGIMNIATAVPQVIAPLLGAIIVVIFAGNGLAARLGGEPDAGLGAVLGSGLGAAADASGSFPGATAGFAALFVVSAIAAALGGVTLLPIKSVK